MSSSGMRWLGIVLIVVGVLGVVAGIIYFTTEIQHLPAFMGQVAHSTKYHTYRGLGGVILGGLLLIGGVVALAYAPRMDRR